MVKEASLFVLAGMIFGRGNLINPRKNCIILYFFEDEDIFLKTTVNKFSEFDPVIKGISLKKIGIDKDISGLCIYGRHGKYIKESTGIDKNHIDERKIPNSITESTKENSIGFLNGLFSINCSIENKGIIFFKHPEIILKDVGIEALNSIKIMLNKLQIESNIENNSNIKYKVNGEEKTKPSILTIKKENAKRFCNIIQLLNSEKSSKLSKITF